MKILDQKLLLVVLVFTASVFIRFYNFENRINFGPEQGMSLIVSGDYIKDKFSLLGQEYFRVTKDGHKLFNSALFSYGLAPLQLLFKFNPVPITAYFALLNLVTGLVILLLVKKVFGYSVALISTILFLFNSFMIYHSMFIWVLNYLPLIGILSAYFIYRFKESSKFSYPLVLGFLSGIAFGLEYVYLFTAGVFFALLMMFSPKRITHGLLFVVGGVIGNLPMVLFDLKHNFYHVQTLWQYTLDTLANPGQNGIMYYHFLQYWPLVMVVGAVILVKIWTESKALVLMILAAYLFINLTSPKVSFTGAVGMLEGMNVKKWEQAAKIIANDNPKDFNIAALLDFDSRANPLRYLVKYKYDKSPKSVEEYRGLDNLYVFAESGYDFTKAQAFEIDAHRPFGVEILSIIDDHYSVFKLKHQD